MTETTNPRTERVRTALIEACHELVSRKPVEDISATEVAELAGVSRPVLYRQFGDVANLVAATSEEFIRSVSARIDEQLPFGDDVEHLEEFMARFVNSVYEQRDFCRNAMYGPSSIQIFGLVSELLRERMERGIVGSRLHDLPDGGADCMNAIAAGVIWMLTVWLDSDFEGPNAPDAMAKRFADTLFQLSGVAHDT